MRLRWWRKAQKTQIPKTDRDTFERLGETVVANVLVGSLNPPGELRAILVDDAKQQHARDWLGERIDSRERRERRSEWIEVAILFFVVLRVILDFLLLRHAR